MKYIILLCDGMGDYPIAELGNRTPMQAANTPNMDELARNGEVGMAKTTPDGFSPGSDVTNLAILGYDPKKYYTGRSPLEAASIGIVLDKDDVAYRCNLVTLKTKNNSYDIESLNSHLIMDDYSAGHITTDEAMELIGEINNQIGTEDIIFYSGISYRHLMVWRGGKVKVRCTPPHDISGKSIGEYLPKGDGDDILKRLIGLSVNVLRFHHVNEDRIKENKKPANCIWLWGQGKAPQMPKFEDKFKLKGAMISAVDLMKGLGIYAGFDIINVPGATGYIDTNYKGKAEYALNELKKKDIVYVHVEAPDEASHNGDMAGKIKAIEDFDNLVVGTVMKGIKEFGDYKIMVLCDHRTPLSTKTHTADPVPVLIFNSKKQGKVDGAFDEATCEKGRMFNPAHTMMEYFLRK
ncbi:MAG: cofactor-independent phosphoglycerate mutase [Nitrospirota bacterium]